MSEGRIDAAVAQIAAGIEQLRVAGGLVSDVESLAVVQQCERLTRRLEHVSLEALGRLERRGCVGLAGSGWEGVGVGVVARV